MEPCLPASPNRDKYEFRDLKHDLEDIQESYAQNYPSELVYQKLFDVAFQMTELLTFVTKQLGQNSELYAKARLKQVEEDYEELKKEVGDERD